MSKPYLLVFPGQGTHEGPFGFFWTKDSKVFHDHFYSLLSYFKEQQGESLEDIIFNHPDQLRLTHWAQPAIYCYQIAAARMLSQHHKPTALTGHSLGEFAAVSLAGGMDVYDGLNLVTQRGLLMQKTPSGKMIAAFCPQEKIHTLLERHPDWACWISAENDEHVTIVSGVPEDIDQLILSLNYLGLRHIPLSVDNAFHTPLMECIAAEWKALCSQIELKSLEIPFYSTIDGKRHTVLPQDYWFTHLFARVRFRQALNALHHDFPQHVCVEVGPGNKLQSYIKKHWDLSIATGPEKQGRELHIHIEELLYH